MIDIPKTVHAPLSLPPRANDEIPYADISGLISLSTPTRCTDQRHGAEEGGSRWAQGRAGNGSIL
eukprot:scaffold2272_cov203-Alexandrium_tamarense.AAC.5